MRDAMEPDLLHTLLKLGLQSAEARALFAAEATLRHYPKDSVIFSQAAADANEYLLLRGVLHRCLLSARGEVVTTGFYMPESVITPHFARMHHGRSLYSLRALTDAVVAVIPVARLDALRRSHAAFRDFGQRVVERELALTAHHEVIFRTCSATERLLSLRENYPNLENLVPHPVIASFLGISSVSLSRLRSRLAGE